MCRLPTLKPKWLRRLRKGFDGIADAVETLKKRRNGKLWKKLEERSNSQVRDDIHVKLEFMNVIQLELVLEAIELIGEATEEFGKQDDFQQSATTLVQDPQPATTFEMDLLNITNEHARAQEEIRKQLENDDDDLEGLNRMVEEIEEPLSNAQLSFSSERQLSSSLESESEESEVSKNPETYRKSEEEPYTEPQNRQRAESNFQEKLREIAERGEENARRVREEKERFEAETEDLRRKHQAEWEAGTAALIECIRLKWRFEKEEDALASWLKLLKNSVSTVKGEFSRLEQHIGFGNPAGIDLREKLGALHDSVEQSYDTVFKAWGNVKELCAQFPGRIFLRILQKNLVDVLNKQCVILKEIDGFEANPTFDRIREAFRHLNPTDIPTTWKLKEDSLNSNWKDYCSEEEPEVYVKQQTMKIEEIL